MKNRHIRIFLIIVGFYSIISGCSQVTGDAELSQAGPSKPVLTFPSSSPYYSSLTLTITGGCTQGSKVVLAGDDQQTIDCNDSSFSFLVSKSVDGKYNFSVAQSQSEITSDQVAIQWVRDSSTPTSNITSSPSSTTVVSSASFQFSSVAGLSFECSLNGAAFSSCSSPISYSGLSNGSHTFSVRSIDGAGKAEILPPIYSWTQQAYNTVSLFHFDTSPGALVDSSSFTGSLSNTLTDSGTTAGASAQFAQARLFTSASSNCMTAPDIISHTLLNNTMTAEAFVRFTSLPGTGVYYALMSKMGTAGQYGWEVGVTRIAGGTRHIYFSASLDGTTAPTTVMSSPVTLTTAAWRHVGVTWNQGTLQFYYDGTEVGSGTIGTPGSASIFPSNALLRIGCTQTGRYLNGILDEVRLSQPIRWSSSFTSPASSYSGD